MRTTALGRPLVMMVTDRQRIGGELLDNIRRGVRAGVDLIQLRERGLEDVDLVAMAAQIRRETAGTPARLVINDRIDVALAAGADGVHLPARAVSGTRVRAIVPSGFLVGRSVHSTEEAVGAAAEGCDYVVFGTVFESAGKPAGHAVAGIEALSRVCAAVSMPVLAIGGITVDRVAEVVRAGAVGVAGIGLFATEDEREMIERVRGIREAFSAR
jgi:thiamine-phosphate pyrophosphorylase